MDGPETVGQVCAAIIKDAYPDYPIFMDTDLDAYLGVFPCFRIQERISRVRLPQSGTHRTRAREMVQITFWQQSADEFGQDTSIVPTLEQAFDDFVPVSIGIGGTIMRLVADGPGKHDFNAQTHIGSDLMTVTASIQPAPIAQPIGA